MLDVLYTAFAFLMLMLPLIVMFGLVVVVLARC